MAKDRRQGRESPLKIVFDNWIIDPDDAVLIGLLRDGRNYDLQILPHGKGKPRTSVSCPKSRVRGKIQAAVKQYGSGMVLISPYDIGGEDIMDRNVKDKYND